MSKWSTNTGSGWKRSSDARACTFIGVDGCFFSTSLHHNKWEKGEICEGTLISDERICSCYRRGEKCNLVDTFSLKWLHIVCSCSWGRNGTIGQRDAEWPGLPQVQQMTACEPPTIMTKSSVSKIATAICTELLYWKRLCDIDRICFSHTADLNHQLEISVQFLSTFGVNRVYYVTVNSKKDDEFAY